MAGMGLAAGTLPGCARRALKTAAAARAARPNVLIMLTDDQGYGDMSCHGNPYLKTPHMDRLHAESVRLTDFHAAPMCTPTRAQLMTGVDCLRNGAMATCLGRSTVREELPMAPEIFAAGGYRTGLFGKWHLGYNWPHRPMDRGFHEATYFLGFGLTGMGHHWNTDYFDPHCYHNGELTQARGYCNDVWFDDAMAWMQQCHEDQQPFFCYLPTNLPHFPEWVDTRYAEQYADSGVADFYGMIANIDDNLGRMDAFLARTGLRDNTIVVFMSDNGGVHPQVYNAGMTGGKCTRTEGGHRVPCFMRWPGGSLRAPAAVATPAQVQDILPTLIELCGLDAPADAAFDGRSLAPLLRGEAIPDRMFVVQYYQNSIAQWDAAVVWNQWRLLYGTQLFDVRADLAQQHDVAAAHPEIVARMRAHYEQWWAGVAPRIDEFVCNHIGAPQQPEAMLCSSDWQDVRADGQASARQPKPQFVRGGPWHVQVEHSGRYRVELRRWPREANAALSAGLPPFVPRFGKPEPEGVALPIAQAYLEAAGKRYHLPTQPADKAVVFTCDLEAGRTTLQAWFADAQGADLCGAFYAYVSRVI